MTNASTEKNSKAGNILPLIVIPVCFVLGILLYKFVFGDASHFKGGDNANDPLPGDYFGVIYKGGFIVPILMGILFIVLVFTVERLITVGRASGNGPVDKFVRNVNFALSKGDVSGALALCDKQKGSVANVVRAGVVKYKDMMQDTSLEKDQKLISIQKEIEEATTLELPMLEQNLPIIATIASVATLVGLIGTVLGMIRAFAGMAHSGAPDASALATGISEALINTALGITTSTIAIIAYSYFTTRIDGMTYRIDEAGYSMQQQFASQHS
ncbi:MAG TPA: MotA/TolQ/ExbB proton channel family protein [Saprospiraceae bacterium]|nr:MotA/TolQ/ExbB proton channel family protein [Saprospiraceae bacterium]HQW55298.1 MotA/TolQ/ExbB proton channel family protein [Saprospiraceae bacterium]